jgi:hypothetical protein
MRPLLPRTVVLWGAPDDDLLPVADASPDAVVAPPPDELVDDCGAAAVVEVPPVFVLLLSSAAAGRAPAKSINSITAPPKSNP